MKCNGCPAMTCTSYECQEYECLFEDKYHPIEFKDGTHGCRKKDINSVNRDIKKWGEREAESWNKYLEEVDDDE